ncbi:MAG: formyltetrahydrofolate deformylase [Opitutales bacterium]
MNNTEETVVALLHGQDRPGIVAGVAGWIYERGGNIRHADQHHDAEAGVFFQRIEWAPQNDPAEEAERFERYASESLGMTARTTTSSHRPKVVLFVSKVDHCFHDTILRFRSGELAGELVAVISNHPELESATRAYGLPFHHIPVTRERKSDAEAEQLEQIHSYRAELIVLARYMQILSENFLATAGCPAINIHHSFLPAFAGGKPYHQAHARGVKLIGATAHYATPDLDEGPIIHQDVTHISHRNSIPDLIRKGKDLEKTVLAQAIRLQLDNRILVYNNKTVVFD